MRPRVRSSPAGVLRAVRQPGLPDAWTGAGVLCDLVRGELYGTGFTPGEVHDVDVAFFDPADLSRRRDEQATARLLAGSPGIPWQARHQPRPAVAGGAGHPAVLTAGPAGSYS